MYILPKDFLDFPSWNGRKGYEKRLCPAFLHGQSLNQSVCIGVQNKKRRDSSDNEPSRRYILIRQEFQFMNVFLPMYKNNEQGLRW